MEFPGSASTCPGQVRRNFRQWSTGQLEKFFAEVVGLNNLDIFFAGKNSPWRGLGRAPMPGRRGRASMPGSWGLTAIGKKKRAAVLPPREDWNFFPGKNPDLGAGLAGLRCRAGAAGRLCQAGMWRARRWASPYWASHQRGWASHQTSLGEPVLIGRTRIGRAIKRGWGEPSNKVGRASTKGPLGEPELIGRARTHWASPYSLGLGEPVLGEPLNHFHSGQRLPLLGAVPARHCACSARLVKCLLGTASACSARSVPTYKCPLGTSTYKCPLGTSTYKCPLGTVPARHV